MNWSVGIVGLGFVGDALKNGFEHFGISDIKCYDPKIDGSKVTDICSCDFIFICVPTPMKSGGHLDDRIVLSVLNDLHRCHADGIIIIKSTLLPTSVRRCIQEFTDLRIVTNPEFLTERRARQDFINTEWILIGGDYDDVIEVRRLYEYVYRDATQHIKYAEVSAESAMMAKYMTNVWFSVKVALMNEFHELWDVLRSQNKVSGGWDDVVNAFSLDNRVGPTHLDVPGPDGDFGFGGKCFPKDLNAMISLIRSHGTSCRILAAAWNDNSRYRRNKDWLMIDGAISGDYVEE